MNFDMVKCILLVHCSSLYQGLLKRMWALFQRMSCHLVALRLYFGFIKSGYKFLARFCLDFMKLKLTSQALDRDERIGAILT